MQRFILQANVERFERQVARETSPGVRAMLLILLNSARRELALFESLNYGSRPDLPENFASSCYAPPALEANALQKTFEASERLSLLIDPRPGLHIVDLTDAYGAATMTKRSTIAGQRLFEVFPDNPCAPSPTGVVNLYGSIQIAARSRQAHAMAIQRYDIRNPEGVFVERYWRPVNTPLLDEEGKIKYILHRVEDVTETVIHPNRV